MLDFPNADLLKCGSCSTEFLLSDIVVFIEHKKQPCELKEQENDCFKCSSCRSTFKCARSLLEHAQYVHKINIFVHGGKEGADSSSTASSPDKQLYIDVSTSNSSYSDKTHSDDAAKPVITPFSLSLSSSSPTTSTSSTLSFDSIKNYAQHHNSQVDNQQKKEPAQRIDANYRFQNSTDAGKNSTNVMIDQNENTSSSVDSAHMNNEGNQAIENRENYFSMQKLSSQNFADKKTRSISSSSDEKKKKTKQTASFYCDVCQAAFNQKIHLTKHSAKHTGIKPFKCSECNYSTVERSHLKVHVRVHTGEKPFKCTFCEYATAQSSTLKIHKKRHHNKLDESVSYRREAKSDDSQSQSCLDMEIDLIKSELKEKADYEEYNFYNEQNFHIQKVSAAYKRNRTFMGEKTKTRDAAYFESIDGTFNNNNKTNIHKKECIKELVILREPDSIEGKLLFKSNIGAAATSNHNSIKPLKNSSSSYLLNESLTEAENKLLGLANIALEREIN